MKEKFKEFIKNNPMFASFVAEGKTTWQKLFELYDLYGEESTIWDEYKKVKEKKESGFAIKDIISSIKGINLDSLGENLSNIQKAIGFLEEITTKDPEKKENKKKKEETSYDKFYSD